MSTSRPDGDRRRDLRADLVDAALELLGAAGVDSLSLRAVARRAGVSAMAPYRHYPDKEALLAAVAIRGFVRLREAVGAAGSAPSGDALVEQAVAYVTFAVANPSLFRLMFGPPRVGHHPELVAAAEATYAVLGERLRGEEVAAALSPRVLGGWSLVHGLALLFLDGQLAGKGFGPADEVTRAVVRAILGDDRQGPTG